MFRLVRVCFILVCVLVAAAGGGELAHARIYSAGGYSGSVFQAPPPDVSLQSSSPQLYLPLLMNNVDAWTSVVYVVYIGNATRTFKIKFYRSDGTPTTTETLLVGPMDLYKFPLDQGGRLPIGMAGSAVVVDAGIDVIAHTNLKNQGELANYSAFGDAGTGDEPGLGTGSSLYVPSFKNQYSGRSTWAYVQNTRDYIININATAWDNVGVTTSSVFTLPPRGVASLSGNSVCPQNRICSLKIEAADGASLLAGIILEANATTGMERAANEMFATYTIVRPIWLPIVKYQYGSQPMSSGFRVQNIGTTDVTPKIEFKGGNLTPCTVISATPLAPGRAVTMAPDCLMTPNTYGYGVVSLVGDSEAAPLAVQANETSFSGTSKKKAYSAPFRRGGFSTTLYGPIIYNITISGLAWNSGLSIMCVGATDITVSYYRTDGTPLNPITFTQSANPIVLVPPANFEGSVKIYADNEVIGARCVGVVNTTNNMPNQETHGLYTMNMR